MSTTTNLVCRNGMMRAAEEEKIISSENGISNRRWRVITGLKKDIEEYAEWTENPVEKCAMNHDESARKMEVDAVVEAFRCSETLHHVKYIH
ncbi:hypothetical protein TNCV_2384221 [Trichonephila clavipes]|nr:hypothetical protein TNCV_2384221 [Trichonephila clavipes]